ncbi:protein-tyrosine phosphatase family protein [Aestuariivirga sp.]|uniref:tyrosine phosphatase family protein n=1 Tax=Aestuariivirga sp. TaxID=2650926 RepID=UPI0025C616A7|nr:protein-tyrosine phosphatase family protein [Aestuariivirga sp.]MCA3554531.1 tyrosine protein phosphatase [Aestuariivirga sp.]
MIVVGPLNKVQALVDEHGVSHVVTLLAPDTPHDAPVGIAPGQHLRLYFHDIVQPIDGHVPPRAADAEKMIAFFQDWDRAAPMLVHCWAGISRSTAAAFTALCLLRPQADEEELAFELRAASPSATPNRLIVSLADEVLGRNGRMVKAIEKIGRGADAFEGAPFVLRP